jgi:hypothetical protein
MANTDGMTSNLRMALSKGCSSVRTRYRSGADKSFRLLEALLMSERFSLWLGIFALGLGALVWLALHPSW